MIVFYSLVVLGLGFVGFQLAQFSLQTSSPKSKLKDDLISIREFLQKLVPREYPKKFDIDLIKEISPNIVKYERVFGINPSKYGSFASIFQEPMIYFAFKQFNTKPGAFLFVTRIGELEFDFFKYDSDVLVYEKERSIGTINSSNQLLNTNGKVIAKLLPSKDLSLYSLYVNEKKVAALIKPEEVSIAEISRLISFLDVSENEMESTLIMISHYLRTMFLD